MATIAVPNQVSISDDAQALYKACKGWGTDEKAIIAVLGRRNAAQRRQIRQAYEELYDEDLVRRLERELSGDFEKAMYRWILDPADRDAVLAHAELRKSSHEHPVLVEISCARSSEELLFIRRAYHARYKRSLEEEVYDYTKGDTRKLLIALVSAFRYEGEEINKKLAKSEAKELHEAIKDNKFNNDDVIRIITSRSKPQLQATFNFYREEEGTSITKNLPNKSKDEFLETLRITVRCFKDPVKYFEKVLRKSIQRLGTDEDALTRVIVTRAEKDLKEIKELYCRRNSVRLDDAVDKDTRGDYKDMLLTLLGNEV
ncbi:annexin-like protein RJ4 [Hibiscus syriacus]|uniref:annexin-like protein RJ4 n=1 Tax=Hibiscus syriacus TaxID=106335 RepID=UPI0019211707|nr:annexin-like protein RJ4 [Hibiscus syriacus]